MAAHYNFPSTVPALFAAHERRHQEDVETIKSLRAEVEALKVIISQWYSVYTDDMPPDGDLLADTDAALRGEGIKHETGERHD